PGKKFEGKIDTIALQAEAASRAVPLWVELKNVGRPGSRVEGQKEAALDRSPLALDPQPSALDPLIRPGMFGSVEIVTDQVDKKVACPTAALVTAGAETY